VIHHIIVCSSQPVLTLPHALNDWSEAEYVRWIDDHEERDRHQLIEGCIPKWEAEVKRYEEKKKSGAVLPENDNGVDYVLLVRTVLDNAKLSST